MIAHDRWFPFLSWSVICEFKWENYHPLSWRVWRIWTSWEYSAWLFLVKWKHTVQSPTITRRLIRALAKRDPQRCRKRLSIGNSIVTRYFQNVSIKPLYFVNFPKSLVLATREKNLEFNKARTKRYDKSLIAIFNPLIFNLTQKLGSSDNDFCCLFPSVLANWTMARKVNSGLTKHRRI